MQILDRQIIVEWRARQIRNPIERLRYLRNAGVDLPIEPVPATPWWKRVRRRSILTAILAFVMLSTSAVALYRTTGKPAIGTVILPAPVQTTSAMAMQNVWLVEHKEDAEIYSNGLRIENRFAVSNHPRGNYRVFARDLPDARHGRLRHLPAGIVYHTTESQLAPFAADQNSQLQRIATEVLTFIQRHHSYHFMIDRFGRIFRLVREEDVAYHAGHSVWADAEDVFVNLNESFLGVAFETQTRRDGDLPAATSAQIVAARLLTEMLRSKYGFPARNCVTHAQVSVNPANMRIGYHTDWAGRFPFVELGLGDNYAEPPASLTAFGFDYDPAFVQSTGTRLLPGLLAAEAQIQAGAARLHVPAQDYRKLLRNHYKEITAASAKSEAAQEIEHEQSK